MHRVRRLAAPLALTLLLAACGGGSDAEAEGEPSAAASAEGTAATGAKPAEDLFVGPPEVQPDAGGTSATLIVTTNKDVKCKVVFGTDEDVSDGEATDADMGEDGHKTHKAVMTGLKPDTEYHYRVEGTDADGTAYESALATFRTSAGGSEKPGANIAVKAKITRSSSEYSADYAAKNAVDGDLATEWSSAGDGDDASITLDFGRIVSLAGVGFRTRSMSDGTAIINTFTVTGDDGKVRGPYSVSASGLTVIPLTLRTRTLRFDAAKTTGGNTGAVEIEAYEAPKAATTKPKRS